MTGWYRYGLLSILWSSFIDSHMPASRFLLGESCLMERICETRVSTEIRWMNWLQSGNIIELGSGFFTSVSRNSFRRMDYTNWRYSTRLESFPSTTGRVFLWSRQKLITDITIAGLSVFDGKEDENSLSLKLFFTQLYFASRRLLEYELREISTKDDDNYDIHYAMLLNLGWLPRVREVVKEVLVSI